MSSYATIMNQKVNEKKEREIQALTGEQLVDKIHDIGTAELLVPETDNRVGDAVEVMSQMADRLDEIVTLTSIWKRR